MNHGRAAGRPPGHTPRRQDGFAGRGGIPACRGTSAGPYSPQEGRVGREGGYPPSWFIDNKASSSNIMYSHCTHNVLTTYSQRTHGVYAAATPFRMGESAEIRHWNSRGGVKTGGNRSKIFSSRFLAVSRGPSWFPRGLSRPSPCTHMYSHVLTCTHMYSRVLTCTHVYMVSTWPGACEYM